jgi:hypothetical protein
MKQQTKWAVSAVVLGAALGCAVPQARAADAPAKAAKPAKHQADADALLKKLTTQLKLTQDEQDKIKPILADEAAQINAANADTTLNKQQRKDRVAAARKAAADQITPVLTDDQQKKFTHAPKEKKAPAGAPKTAPTGSTQAN